MEAEQGVLGCLLLSPSEVLPIVRRQIHGPEVFYDLRHRTIYQAMAEMEADGTAIDTITLQQRLKDKRQLDGVGGLAFLSALPDSVPSAANVGYYLEIVREKFILRSAGAIAVEMQAHLDKYPDKASSILHAATKALADLERNGNSGYELALSRRFDPTKPPLNVPPVFTICGVPTCTRGNITVIDAQAKAGKTALLGGMIASVIMPAVADVDTFGVSARNESGLSVLHFDTEQSREHHWHQIDRIRQRAKLEELPPWFNSFWLSGVHLKEVRAIIERQIEASRTRGGIHSIFIDGVADLVIDVNDSAECNEFVAYLHGLAIDNDCPIIGVIHRNPNGEKTRGHLGSQLERKAESNLTMEKDGEVTSVWSVRQRGAPLLKGQGPCFRWSDEQQMHVSCQGFISSKQLRKIEVARMAIDDVFCNRPSMRYSDLVSEIVSKFNKATSTAENWIRDWTTLALIHQPIPSTGLYAPRR